MGHEVGKADIVKTNVQVPEYKFSNQTDVSEEAQTEETEHVSKNTDQDEYDHNRGGCSSCLTCSWDYYKESCR